MSKKLLMNSYSGSDGLKPVQDGLVCWLDAFDLTSYAQGNTWNDKSGNGNNGIVEAITTLNSINNGILHANSLVNIPNPTKGLSQYTVEIGYEDISKKYWMGLWGNRSGNTGVSFYQTGGNYKTYPSLSFTASTKDEISGGKNFTAFIFNEKNIEVYHNGEIVATGSNLNIKSSTANYLCFMSRKPNTATDDTTDGVDRQLANWYYIRIYNKALTEEEVLNNYNYEMTLERG